MTKPVHLESIRPTCGSCAHWRESEQERGFGECCSMPAIPVVDYDENGEPYLISARPYMGADDWSCIYFRGGN